MTVREECASTQFSARGGRPLQRARRARDAREVLPKRCRHSEGHEAQERVPVGEERSRLGSDAVAQCASGCQRAWRLCCSVYRFVGVAASVSPSAQARLPHKTRQGQISPAGASAKAAAFSSERQRRMAELGVDIVYNADQTPVSIEYILTKTIATKETQTVWVRTGGKAKERVTCMLLGDSFGNKFEPSLVLKTTTPVKKKTATENNTRRHGFGKRLWVKVRGLQSAFSVQIFGNATAWWNTEMSVRFLEYHFCNRACPSYATQSTERGSMC